MKSLFVVDGGGGWGENTKHFFLLRLASANRVVCTHLEIMTDSLDWYLNATLINCAIHG